MKRKLLYGIVGTTFMVLFATTLICDDKKLEVVDPVIVTDTVIVKVIEYDTFVKHVNRTSIKYRERVIRDTVFASSPSAVNEKSNNCFSVEDTQSGAYIKAEFCSKEFPKEKPLDLTGTIEYSPPSDTVKALTYISKPSKKSMWTAGIFGVVIGTVATLIFWR